MNPDPLRNETARERPAPVAVGTPVLRHAEPGVSPAGAWDRFCEALAWAVPPLGRILLSQVFLMAGVEKLMDWNGTARQMADHGMPIVPVLLVAAVFAELAGGLSLLLGFYARFGALGLFLFLIPTSLIFHDFWNHVGMDRQSQMLHFEKNLAIMGGLLIIVGLGAGRLSIDRWLWRRE